MEERAIPPLQLGLYEHYKGKQYEVIGVGLDTETLEPLVIYKPVYETKAAYWVRPYKMFTSTVDVGGKTVPRFKKIN